MPGVAGGRKDLEVEQRAAEHMDVCCRNRLDVSEQAVEGGAVERAGAFLEATRVDQVRSATLVDVDLQVWVPPHEPAGGAAVVGVDVGEQEVAHVREVDGVRVQATKQRIDAARRAAVDERRLGAVEQPGSDHARPADVVEVDEDRHVAQDAAACLTAARILT